MLLALFIGLFLSTILAHEAGHAIYMRAAGTEISEMGFGVPWGPHLRFKPRRLPFHLRLNLIPLVAYVRPADDAAIERLPYRRKVRIAGAGIMANWCCGWLLISAGMVAAWLMWHDRPTLRLTMAALGLGVTAVTLRFFKPITERALGYISFGMLFLLPAEVLTIGAWGLPFSLRHLTLPASVFYAGIASLNLALINLAPLGPLDGSRIVNAWSAERWSETTQGTLDSLRFVMAMPFIILCLPAGPLVLWH